MAHLSARSYDRTGCYSRALASRAGQDFHRGLRRYWLKIATGVLALLLAALALDLLTSGTGIQRRPNVHLTILFLEIMVWARYGAAVVIAAARWSSRRPPAFARARELAASTPVARSFALNNIAFAAAALAAVAGYKWGGALLPSARAELFSAAGVFVCLAFLALWLQCRWARYILPQIAERSSGEAVMPESGRLPELSRRLGQASDDPTPGFEPMLLSLRYRLPTYIVAPICQGTNSLSP